MSDDAEMWKNKKMWCDCGNTCHHRFTGYKFRNHIRLINYDKMSNLSEMNTFLTCFVKWAVITTLDLRLMMSCQIHNSKFIGLSIIMFCLMSSIYHIGLESYDV